MDDPLNYFNPRTAAGRTYLSRISLILVVIAVPSLLLIIPGFILALVAMGFGAAALRHIDPKEEFLAYKRAEGAIVLAFVELILACALAGTMLSH